MPWQQGSLSLVTAAEYHPLPSLLQVSPKVWKEWELFSCSRNQEQFSAAANCYLTTCPFLDRGEHRLEVELTQGAALKCSQLEISISMVMEYVYIPVPGLFFSKIYLKFLLVEMNDYMGPLKQAIYVSRLERALACPYLVAVE